MRPLLLAVALILSACGGPDDSAATETCAVVYDPQHPGQYHVGEECTDGGVQ